MPAIMATFGANVQPFNAAAGQVVSTAGKIGQGIVSGVHPGSGAIRELIVLLREISAGRWTNVPGSLSILITRLGLLRALLSPIALGIGAVAAGFAYAWYTGSKLAQTADNINRALTGGGARLREMADAMQRASEKAATFRERMAHIRDDEDQDHPATIAQAKERFERRISEEKAAQREAAANVGARPLSVLKQDAERAAAIVEKAQYATTVAQSKSNSFRDTFGPLVGLGRHSFAHFAVEQHDIEGVGKISLLEATRQSRIAQERYANTVARQESLDENQKRAEEATNRAKEALRRLQENPDSETVDLNEAQKARLIHGNVNAMQAVGAFASPASIALGDTAKKMEKHLASIDRKLGPASPRNNKIADHDAKL